MPSLIDIRRRIRSVKNTQQITRALKMISAAKLRRAQERVVAARPYSAMLRETLANLAAAVAGDDAAAESPLLARREEKRILLILLTSDTGKAGAFNANLTRAGQRFIDERKPAASVEVVAIGRRGLDFFRKREYAIAGEYIHILKTIEFSNARAIAHNAIDRYSRGEIDAVYIINSEFKSVLSQKVMEHRVLPVDLPEANPQNPPEQAARDYIFEQPPLQMLEHLLPRFVEAAVYQAMLETAAGEHAARMTAMDAATTNAGDVIDSLTLTMNRARQAAITKEIIEVVSGAAAGE
ncbi:MAG TPA: ATP synthase F1 subunit gamma [Solibacterales bacterium]|nr:ATP synthase F1 subunit gamma [Bryobacterales bacterium]